MINRCWLLPLTLSLITSCYGEADNSKSEEVTTAVLTMKPFIAVWRILGPKILQRDTQRTLTRRDSSLIVSKNKVDDDTISILTIGTVRDQYPNASESSITPTRPKGSVRKEIVTLFFESMLSCIVDSWDVLSIAANKQDEVQTPDERSITEPSVKKKKSIGKLGKPVSLKVKRSRSKLEVNNDITPQVDPLQRVWWSGPDERAIVRFKNGNVYEGCISMKNLHGEGRFQWADGTIYFGNFKDNEICGQGKIVWKDDTWYEGEFLGNMRHGKGLFVDSRRQRTYSGEWHNGTKHGHGVMFYAEASYKNSYDGKWEQNVRHGFGLREYCNSSGYQGTYDNYTREGEGLMIWPNHDVYRGGWKNGLMNGRGIYIWDVLNNYTMSMARHSVYIGDWLRGERHGNGTLSVGIGFGALYKGQFKNNKKHGLGKFITSNGYILRNNHLFIDDNFGSLNDEESAESLKHSLEESTKTLPHRNSEPYAFDMCDDRVGLTYHVHQAYNNIDRQHVMNTEIINEYFKCNKIIEPVIKQRTPKRDLNKTNKVDSLIDFDVEEFFMAEKTFLYQAIKCYERTLKYIYHKYSTICNSNDVSFQTVLIRLYLWQLFFDCNIHKKGLTFVEIDKLIRNNPDWQLKTTHYPFQTILFWQFLHCLISLAIKLYGKKELPGPMPDNICGCAFRKLMDCDILPGIQVLKGNLAKGHAKLVPLKGLYQLYRSLGEPHTVRTFIMATRKPTHDLDEHQPRMKEMPYNEVEMGYNAYVMGEEMRYIVEDEIFCPEFVEIKERPERKKLSNPKLKLFNFANIPIRTIISFFANVFPQMITDGKLMDLEIEITFYEFFEVFLSCVEESNRIADYSDSLGESKSDTLLMDIL